MATTPRAAALAQLLGAQTFGALALTRDEMRAINELYGLRPEPPTKKPAPPVPPKEEDFGRTWEYRDAQQDYERQLRDQQNWKDPRELLQAGADRNAIRHAELDGLRIVAWLAKHTPAGEDPLKQVIQLACQAGWDVDPEDVGWAENEEE